MMKAELMAWTALQILVMAASLLAQNTEMAQKAVVISVSFDGNNFRYHIGFSISLFTEFHKCLSKGADSCVVPYELSNSPNCIAESVNTSGQSDQESNYYYKCTNNGATSSLNCQRQLLASTPSIPPDTYLLRNSSYSSTCFGFLWTLTNEGISFKSDQFDIEFCGSDCSCPSRSTTSQPEETTNSPLQSPGGSLPSIPVTTSPSRFSLPSATSGTSTEKSGDDPPIGVIVGAAVSAIVIIVIIIIIVVIRRRRRAKAKSSDHVDHETSTTSSNGAGVNSITKDGKSHLFSDNSGELQTKNTSANNISGYHSTLHQPNITKNGEAPVKHQSKPQFAIKDNDSNFGYSTAQVVVPENNHTKSKKTHDNYDYVSVEDDTGVPDPKPEATRAKNPAVNPPKVKDDYAVVDKTHTTDLNQEFANEYSRASDGYSTAGNGNQPNPNNDDPDATGVYSKLHQEVRDIKNPYNVLPEAQGTSDSNSALPDTVHNAQDNKVAKPSKSLPYGREDYAVVVKTKSTNKPTQASFQLRNNEN